MKNVSVVIGANYGDEGKGLVTDCLASRAGKGVVVRFNGGAQAGHTVVTPDGKRHVFHHFGAGALAGVPTYLSSFFVVNPVLFLPEYRALGHLGGNTTCIAALRCPVTTPWDMMLNQAIETKRGDLRHGSCGVGFGETLERHTHFPLTLADLKSEALLKQRLARIRQEWVPQRMRTLGLTSLPPCNEDAVFERFVVDCGAMGRLLMDSGGAEDLNRYDDVIFEGAQGLMLDMDAPGFPHVTRSHTGLRNPTSLLEEAGFKGLVDVFYVTRPYVTRHGNGPLNHVISPTLRMVCKTNVTNEFQGELRYGRLSEARLLERITSDLDAPSTDDIEFNPHLALTCVDHIEQYVETVERRVAPQQLCLDLLRWLRTSHGLLSFGETRRHVVEIFSGQGVA